MRFTLSWLKDFLDTTASLQEISEQLTALGLEVEKIIDKSAELAPFHIAEIIETQPHPNADKLRVCKVNTGSTILQIVCGAPNARAGIKVVLAESGSVIPTNGMKIKPSKIRDVESNGMLCSARELGIGEDHNGIIELSNDAPLGQSFAQWEGLNDPVIEIAITPNRGDCLGVYGIARDLAATDIGTLKPLTIPAIKGTFPSPIAVLLEDEAGCPLFIGRYIKNVTNSESPAWLKKRLEAIGISPISALVDITNYISFTYGRPLHVYDADKLQGNIVVRKSAADEKFAALNDKNYTLAAGLTVVADSQNIVALGGVIGGADSGCSLGTTNVLLESAFFDPSVVTKTGRLLQIDTDSRYRFEREVDKGFVKNGADIAISMILSLCGGEVSDQIISGKEDVNQRVISFNASKVLTLGGIDLDGHIITSILEKLGFTIKGSNVTIPSWRNDIHGEADLVEEVLRVYGYDALPATPLPAPPAGFSSALSPEQRRVNTSKTLLAARGFTEIVSWSFMPTDIAALFGGGQPALRLQNPISSELESMRPSLLPNLLDAFKRNSARGFHDLMLFEAGPEFHGVKPEEQPVVISGIRTGQTAPKNHYHDARTVEVSDIKTDIFALLTEYNVATDRITITRDVPDWYHPGRSGVLRLGNKALGVFGELHPALLQQLDIKTPTVAFELFIQSIPYPKQKNGRKTAPNYSDYQAVQRDFAFIVDSTVESGKVIRAVESAEKELITQVSLFDVYSGKGVEEGKKSLALSVTLQAKNRTLTEEEIESSCRKIIESVGKNTEGVLRE